MPCAGKVGGLLSYGKYVRVISGGKWHLRVRCGIYLKLSVFFLKPEKDFLFFRSKAVGVHGAYVKAVIKKKRRKAQWPRSSGIIYRDLCP